MTLWEHHTFPFLVSESFHSFLLSLPPDFFKGLFQMSKTPPKMNFGAARYDQENEIPHRIITHRSCLLGLSNNPVSESPPSWGLSSSKSDFDISRGSGPQESQSDNCSSIIKKKKTQKTVSPEVVTVSLDALTSCCDHGHCLGSHSVCG